MFLKPLFIHEKNGKFLIITVVFFSNTHIHESFTGKLALPNKFQNVFPISFQWLPQIFQPSRSRHWPAITSIFVYSKNVKLNLYIYIFIFLWSFIIKISGKQTKNCEKKHVNKKIRNIKKQTKEKMFTQFVTNMKIMNITWTLIWQRHI